MEPARFAVAIEALGAGSRLTTVTTFTSAKQLEQVAMGVEEGMRLAMGQIDALLADAPR